MQYIPLQDLFLRFLSSVMTKTVVSLKQVSTFLTVKAQVPQSSITATRTSNLTRVTIEYENGRQYTIYLLILCFRAS